METPPAQSLAAPPASPSTEELAELEIELAQLEQELTDLEAADEIAGSGG